MKTQTQIRNIRQRSSTFKYSHFIFKTIFVLLFFCYSSTSFSQRISAGSAHSVFICNNGNTVNTSGINNAGQLGDGTTTQRTLPVLVNGLTGVKAIAAGLEHTLVLRTDSTVWAWGSNAYGQLGDSTNISKSTPVQVKGLTGVIAISAGQAGYHSIALRAGDSTVWTWGRNGDGQLGDGSVVNNNFPKKVTTLSNIIAIGGGEYHSLALEDNGTVWAWGDNLYGQIGDGTKNNDRSTPVQVSGLTGITSVKAGRFFSLALKNDSTIHAWGQNNNGQLGNGTTTDTSLAVQVTGLSKITAIAGGAFHALAIKSDSTIVAWGRNDHGMLGNGTTTPSSVPVAVNSLTKIVAIAGGTNFSLAVKDNDSTFAWGRNANGQLGDGTTNTPITNPMPVLSLCPTFAANPVNANISAGVSHTAFLCNDDSTANITGLNSFGQLGDGTTTQSPFPVLVNGLTEVKAIAVGYEHTLALRTDSTVWSWGGNTDGQLGDGTNVSKTAPVMVNGLAGVIAISGGQAGYHSLALKADGTVWAWGRNGDGQLGDGTTANKNVPTQVSGLTGIIAIAGGEYHSLALKNDATVRAWGKNNKGQLGDGTTANRTSPVLVSGLKNITSVKGGRYFSIALQNDRTVHTWGENSPHGQLGNGTTTDSPTPVVVTGLTDITAIAGGAFHVLAIKSDSTLVAWGRNDYGMLGNGTVTAKSTVPVTVNSLTKVVGIAGGTNYSLAVTDNDSTYGWGRNPNGQLGDGQTGNVESSPKLVGALCPTCFNSASTFTVTACLTYTVPSGTQTYSVSGTYTDIIPNAAGCDSILTVNLTIGVNTSVTQSANGVTLTAAASGATYQWIDCGNGNDTIAGETAQIYTATVNGSYAVIVTKSGCTDTSSCYAVNTVGIADAATSSGMMISVYPNPSGGMFNVQIPIAIDLANGIRSSMEIYNVLGEKVHYQATSVNNEKVTINLSSQPNGIYYISIISGENTFYQKLIKQ